MENDSVDGYVDLMEAARIPGIHPQRLRHLIGQKKVPTAIFAGKFLIERNKLDLFKASRE